tara:strand:- start:127 stop:423 length:297 start_codon:yes stop_codon:yes gene_type:complete
VPEAGSQYFGISRSSAYQAAHRGEIPTIRIGKLLRVPVAALDAIFEEATGTHIQRTHTAVSIPDDRPLETQNSQICGGHTGTRVGPSLVSKCYDTRGK